MKNDELDKIFEDFDFEEEDETVETVEKIILNGNFTDFEDIWSSYRRGVSGRGRGYIFSDTMYSSYSSTSTSGSSGTGISSISGKNNSKYDKPKPTTNKFNDEQKLKPQHYPYRNSYKK